MKNQYVYQDIGETYGKGTTKHSTPDGVVQFIKQEDHHK